MDKEIFTQETEVGAKNTKVPRMAPKYLIVIAMVLIVICSLVAGIFIGINIYGVSPDEKDMVNKMPDLAEIYKLIDQYYYKDIDWNEVQDRTVAGMGKMDLFSGVTIDEISTSGAMGLRFRPSSYNELFVVGVTAGSMADKARGKEINVTVNPITKRVSIVDIVGAENTQKVERGDLLVAIKPSAKDPYIYAIGVDYGQALSVLQAPTLGGLIFRKTDGRYIELNIGKDATATKIAYYKSLGNDTGYICLTSFDEENIEDFFEAAKAFVTDDHAHKLILDLRLNGGGSVQMLAKIIPFFIKKAAPAIEVMKISKKNDAPMLINGIKLTGANGLQNDYFGNAKGKAYKLAIMVDGGSASASEGLVGAVRYYEPSTIIVGTPTYGKGVAQFSFPNVCGKYNVSIVAGEFFVLTGELGKGEWKNFHQQPMLPTYNFNDADKYNEMYGIMYPDLTKEVDIAKAMELLK